MSADSVDLETYLVQRKRRRRMLLATGVAVFIGIVAVPYALMHAGMLSQNIFEIFVAADVLIASASCAAWSRTSRTRLVTHSRRHASWQTASSRVPSGSRTNAA